jgi:signal transduction histidine kinase
MAPDYNWSRVSLFSSLTNRIFVASALLAVVSIAVGIYNVNKAVTTQAERDLRRGLEESRTLIEENRRILVEHFSREARLIADLPRLKAAVELNDPPTVLPVVEEYQQQLEADLFMVTHRSGRVLASLPRGNPTSADGLPGLRRAAEGQDATTFLAQPGGVLQVVSVPIWINPDAPAILGTLSVGFSLDRRAAARFGALTNSDIAFGVGGVIHSSTLPPAGWPALASLLAREGLTERVWLGGSEYIAMTVALPSDVGSPVVARAALTSDAPGAKAIILRSRTERLSFLTPLHTSLLVTALFVVLAATVISYGIARTVTRPLGTITATMREMAATGDLTRRIPLPADPRWEDEDARLLASTFNMMTSSIEQFQREAAQRERLSALGRLSTVVAHEIRNPLMIIKAALRGLRRDDVQNDTVKAAVADIDEEIVRLNRIVTEVLDFAKPIRFELTAVDLNALCTDAVKACGTDADAATVTLALDPALSPIVTDAERLRLVLVNLLTNARHAVAARPDAAGLRDAISLKTGCLDGDRVRLEVRDRGAGISPEDLPRIFDPYFTTRRTGTGLGLAISRNIVEGLKGRISVESRVGEGTSVRIELPAA